MTDNPFDRLHVVTGDITVLTVDAIVNAANSSLRGGGGVDGAIHRAAGPQLLAACRRIGGCPTGEARITEGFHLPARWVIHTVGPVYRARPEDKQLLSACYTNSLALAAVHRAATVAFPAISCGVYGYPMEAACPVAVDATVDFLRAHNEIKAVSFVLFSAPDAAVYHRYIGMKASC